jgi:hypothetical protein
MAEFLDSNLYTNSSELQKAQSAEAALEEIQTERFSNTLKSYYSYRDGGQVSKLNSADLLDYFYEDRSWRNNNTISMGLDLTNMMGSDAERVKEFAYIQQTYSSLPSFWNDPNRNFGGWLIDNGGAMLLDPINLIGVGVGGQAAKQSFKLGLKELLKSKMAGEINKAAIEEMAQQATKAAMGKAIKKGAIYEGYFGAITNGVQDMILQNTAIKADVQTELDLRQTALSTAAGFGFGTVFGGAFTAGAFKITNRNLKNTAVKNLADIHEFGQSNITGRMLFKDLSEKKAKPELYKNQPKKTKAQIAREMDNADLNGDTFNMRFRDFKPERISGEDKPSNIPINITRYTPGAYRFLIKQRAKELKNKVDSGETISLDDMVEIAAKRQIEMGNDPAVVRVQLRKMAKDPKMKEQFAYRVIAGDLLAKDAAELVSKSNELGRIDLTATRRKQLLQEWNDIEAGLDELVQINSDLGTAGARSVTAGRIIKDKTRAAQLIANPEDPKMKAKKAGNKEAFIEALGKLDDDEQVILALQNSKTVSKWDLAAEWVNNNLLSSPDTHELNLISGLLQTQWKPFVMLLRSLNMVTTDRNKAMTIAREAIQTYIYQYIYLGHAFKKAGQTLIKGRATLDSGQMKFDGNIRQGQLQRFISAMGKTISEPIAEIGARISNDAIGSIAGKVVQAPFEVAGFAQTIPLRVLAAGDEFMKTMAFKARMTSIINTEIMRTNPEYGIFVKGRVFTEDYKLKFKELEKKFINENGVAKAIGTTVGENLNAPLQYARDVSFTNTAYSTNPTTGEEEGGITGYILDETSKGKLRSFRVLGLHFINTPSNLLRWNFQHLPLLGRYQFQMRHMLAEAEDVADGSVKHVARKGFAGLTSLKSGLSSTKKNYLNPEAAAEANARIQAGWMLWSSAFALVSAGRFTGGGHADWRENESKADLVGWKPYAYKTADGRYIQFNRLDPIMTPIFIMADIFETLDKTNGVIDPKVESGIHELVMGTVMGLSRNLTSKFYTKNIMDTYQSFFGGGLASARKPEQRIEASFAKGLYKFLPLSGGVRYTDRITDEFEKDLWTFSDRMQRYFQDNPNEKVMSKRNIWGEKIKTKRAWLFGLGGDSGVISSPFGMTAFKNNATARFFNSDERENISYRQPSAVAKNINNQDVDLKTLRNSSGQTAYDRWLEIKSELRLTSSGSVSISGKGVSLKDYIENLIADKDSNLYTQPSGVRQGKDLQQMFIMSIIHGVENVAYNVMQQEFPQLIAIQETEIKDLIQDYKNQNQKKKGTLNLLTNN